MTPEFFAETMQTIATIGDTENAHVEADALLCAALVEHGYTAGVETFLKMHKWYA